MAEHAALRERLIEMRRSLLDAMRRDGPEPSWLAMMAGIAATLDALGEENDARPRADMQNASDASGRPQ